MSGADHEEIAGILGNLAPTEVAEFIADYSAVTVGWNDDDRHAALARLLKMANTIGQRQADRYCREWCRYCEKRS